MQTPITLAADANTDIWKKPPTHNVFTGKQRFKRHLAVDKTMEAFGDTKTR
jgi:hypothetical protein